MAKLILNDLANFQNESSATATLNANNATLETALENTLSRDGTSPNQMAAALDMNSNRIINLPEPVDSNEPVRLIDVNLVTFNAAVEDVEIAALAAQASATSATSSVSSAAAFANNAENSADEAAASAETVAAATATLAGLGTMSTQNANTVAITGGSITGMASPISNADVVNKEYVDTVATGLRIHEAVIFATTGVLSNSPTYANGTAGVGATLTAGSNGILTIDGSATVLGNRILVKDQVSTAHNGIFKVTTEGTAGVSYILTREIDLDIAAEMSGGNLIPVQAGAQHVNTSWMLTTEVTTVGTDPLLFSQFGSGGGNQWVSSGSDIENNNVGTVLVSSFTLPGLTGLLKARGASTVTTALVGTDFQGVSFRIAVGSASDAIDDSVAINSQITAINAAGGGVLYFPDRCDVRIQNPIIIKPGVYLVGMGVTFPDSFGPRIMPAANMSALIKSADPTVNTHSCGIIGLGLHGRPLSFTVNNLIDIGLLESRIERCYIYQGTGNGIYWRLGTDPVANPSWTNSIRHNTIGGFTAGWALVAEGTDGWISENYISGCQNGILNVTTGANRIIGNTMEIITSTGMRVGTRNADASWANIIIGNYIVLCATGLHIINSTPFEFRTCGACIDSNLFNSNVTHDILIDTGMSNGVIGPSNSFVLSAPTSGSVVFGGPTVNPGWMIQGSFNHSMPSRIVNINADTVALTTGSSGIFKQNI